MKIVHVIGRLGIGGAERFVVDVCNEMAKNSEYKLFIISLCGNDPAASFVSEINKEVRYISFNKNPGFSLNALLNLTKWLKAENPDVIHSHLNGFEYLILYHFYKSRTAFFHTIHNIAEAECPSPLLKYYRKAYYKSNKVIPVTISANGSQSFKAYYHLNNDITIENGRPPITITSAFSNVLKKYKSSIPVFTIVNIGRITVEKNQRLLITAVKLFNAETPLKKCKLLLIGEVQDEQVFKELNSLADGDLNIEFLGARTNIADYLTLADVFCLSSLYEGMPISLIEAMSIGCIPACTPVGGIKEMINEGETGFLSEDLTLQSFLEALKRAVYFENKAIIKQKLISTFYEKYHIGISARKHLDAYQHGLEQSNKRNSNSKTITNK